MNELLERLFSSEKGKLLYSNAKSAISENNMSEIMQKGVLLGFSGGADSVALLCVLLKYRETVDFSLKAVHINHGIRCEEAERDEAFSEAFCKRMGVDFQSVKINVPKISKAKGIGLEEAARNERYRIFDSILSGNEDLSSIAVAHNSTDNLETILFNMLRGTGATGAAGIKPVRNNVIRPLIYSSKELIVSALSDAGIDFVLDSTNDSLEYSRNYIRHEIIPRLKKITPSPELMGVRFSQNLRQDSDFILSLAKDFVKTKCPDGVFLKEDFLNLSKPVFARVLTLLSAEKGLPSPEKTHIDAIYGLCFGGDFSYSIPGGARFISSQNKFYIGEFEKGDAAFLYKLKEGLNTFSEFGSVVLISKEKNVESYSNIYKISIQEKLKFDIINSDLCIRSKKDGDAYRYGNMTRKLKKLFSDKKVPSSARKNIPLFCDRYGILWVPGLNVREGIFEGEEWYITIMEPYAKMEGKRYFSQFPKN